MSNKIKKDNNSNIISNEKAFRDGSPLVDVTEDKILNMFENFNDAMEEMQVEKMNAEKETVEPVEVKTEIKEVKNENSKLKIVFAASEAAPFVKTGGLGDVAAALPKALNKLGAECRVILPLYSFIKDEYKNQMKLIYEAYVPLGWRNMYMGIKELQYDGITYYFIDNEYYFNRPNAYGYFDDGERIGYYSKALLEALEYIDFEPNVLHLNDWHTALSAVYLREMYRGAGLDKFKKMKTIITIHNLKFQGMYSTFVLDDITGLGSYKDARRQLLQGDAVNFMRGGLNYTDFITTVSPTYAEEIKTDYYGEKLNDIFLRRADIVKGILNGIDYNDYNPKTDKNIFKNFSVDTIDDKKVNKLELQKQLGLNVDENAPLICLVSRLTEQKGIDLITTIFEELMNTSNAQFVMLGLGEKKYEDAFYYFQSKYGGRVSVNTFFSEELSRKIYAGSDLILIPSKFEPCGLTQMIAMSYITLPIVRETGGLKDTVKPYNQFTGEGNGFSFANYNAHEMLFTIKMALNLYNENKDAFKRLMQNAGKECFSWERAAGEYISIYKHILSY